MAVWEGLYLGLEEERRASENEAISQVMQTEKLEKEKTYSSLQLLGGNTALLKL